MSNCQIGNLFVSPLTSVDVCRVDSSVLKAFRLTLAAILAEELCRLIAQTLVYAFSRICFMFGLGGGDAGGKGTSARLNSPVGGDAGKAAHKTSSILRASSNANSRFISSNSQR